MSAPLKLTIPHIDGIDTRGAALQFDEHRLCGQVVVPQVVAHELAVPDLLSGARAQGDQRVGVRVVPAPARQAARRPGGGSGGVDAARHRPPGPAECRDT